MTYNSVDHSCSTLASSRRAYCRLLERGSWRNEDRRICALIYFRKISPGIQAWVLLYLEPECEALRHSVTGVLRQVKEDQCMGRGMKCRLSFQLTSFTGHFKMEDECVCRSRTVRFGSLARRADVGNIYKCSKFLKPKIRCRRSVLCSTIVKDWKESSTACLVTLFRPGATKENPQKTLIRIVGTLCNIRLSTPIHAAVHCVSVDNKLLFIKII